MLPLKAGSLTQSSPPVRSLEGMQDRDHIWPPFHSDWYLECILSFFLFPSLHLLRHPNLLLGLSMAIHPYPPKLQEFGQEYAKSMGVSEATRQFSMFQLEIQDQQKSEKCLVDSILSILNSWPIISFVVTAVLLYQVRFWEPCHFDRAYCYILQFLWFRAEVLFEFTVEVTQERDMIEQWKKPDVLVYIRELYYPVKHEDWGFNKPL